MAAYVNDGLVGVVWDHELSLSHAYARHEYMHSRIAEGQAAADGASAGLVAALQRLVDGEGR